MAEETRNEAIIRLRKAGLSLTQISKRMGGRVTRGVVIGVLNRAGMCVPKNSTS